MSSRSNERPETMTQKIARDPNYKRPRTIGAPKSHSRRVKLVRIETRMTRVGNKLVERQYEHKFHYTKGWRVERVA